MEKASEIFKLIIQILIIIILLIITLQLTVGDGVRVYTDDGLRKAEQTEEWFFGN